MMVMEPLAAVGRLAPLSLPAAAPSGSGSLAGSPTGFGQLLREVVGQHQQDHAAAETAVRELATGQTQNLHTVALAVAKADISFRLLLELRNRLSDAYQEVTRMQV